MRFLQSSMNKLFLGLVFTGFGLIVSCSKENEAKEKEVEKSAAPAEELVSEKPVVALTSGIPEFCSLGQEDLASADILAIKQAGLRLGISTHSWFEAAIAHRYKPSYIALGPVFPTTCKSMRFGPQGFAKLKQWKDAWPYPVIAIGGLKVEHAKDLNHSGVDGVAVISDITKAEDPKHQVEAWLKALNAREKT